eukprot:scaffold14111_cov17-Tisochrysis_lutea.AAC.1
MILCHSTAHQEALWAEPYWPPRGSNVQVAAIFARSLKAVTSCQHAAHHRRVNLHSKVARSWAHAPMSLQLDEARALRPNKAGAQAACIGVQKLMHRRPSTGGHA